MIYNRTLAKNGRMHHRGDLEECHPLMGFQEPTIPTRNHLFTPSKMPEEIEIVAVCAPILPQVEQEEMYLVALLA